MKLALGWVSKGEDEGWNGNGEEEEGMEIDGVKGKYKGEVHQNYENATHTQIWGKLGK